MDYDGILVKIFLNKLGNPNGNKTKRIQKYPNISNYLLNRYDDSISVNESLMRIRNNIENTPRCLNCNNKLTYKCAYKGMAIYGKYCCSSCAALGNQEKIKETCIKKYGVDNPAKSDIIKQKTKETCLRIYGETSHLKVREIREKIENSLLRSYGVKFPGLSGKIRNKSIQTSLNRYGVDNPAKSDIVKRKFKDTCIRKYGEVSPLLTKEARKSIKEKQKQTTEKIINTKRKNHTFNTSKPEEKLYLYIKEKFPSVLRQYKDKNRYPYYCDFYIPELDYFIELQGYYTHGNHPYDPSSIDDQKMINKYNEKYGYNCQPITIWTIKDPEKRKCAKEHNLNFKEVWSLQEGIEFINMLSESKS